MNTILQENLQQKGWFLASENPLIIKRSDESYATGEAAQYILDSLEKELTSVCSILKQLNSLNSQIQAYVNNAPQDDDDSSKWEIVYDLVFSAHFSKNVNSLLKQINTQLDYYDPDTSYRDDVLAFANALNSKIKDLNSITHCDIN